MFMKPYITFSIFTAKAICGQGPQNYKSLHSTELPYYNLATTSCCAVIQYSVKNRCSLNTIIKGDTFAHTSLSRSYLQPLSEAQADPRCRLDNTRKTAKPSSERLPRPVLASSHGEPRPRRPEPTQLPAVTETSHAANADEASDLPKGQHCVFENWKKGKRFPLFHITTPP